MSFIRRVEVRGYRAFPGATVDSLELGDKRHLLLFGENGSGKSSLAQALRDLLDPRTEAQGAAPFAKVRNVFDDPAYTGGEVTLHFDDATPALSWTYLDGMGGRFRPNHPLWDPMSRSAAWMDYQRLRRLYESKAGSFLDDLFPLCLDLLLVDVPLSETNVIRFSEEWRAIRDQAAARRGSGSAGARAISAIRRRISAFNTALKGFVEIWQRSANELLAQFVESTELLFDTPTSAEYVWVGGRGAGWRLRQPVLRLRVRYRNHEPPNPLVFLNESRLTACGLALWLAALLRTRPLTLAPGQTYSRVLVLDDLLLSLDMDHRIPLIEVLRKHFGQWQVFVLTHDAGWFEVMKTHLPDWKSIELFSRSDGTRDFPAFRQSTDFLVSAEAHLRNRDYKATGVYLRSAFEVMLRQFSEKQNLPIKYVERRKDLTTDDFWPQIEKRIAKNGEPIVPEALAIDVRRCRSHVLNPLCHDSDHRPLQSEVRSAIAVLRALQRVLTPRTSNGSEKPGHLSPLNWAIIEILDPPLALDPGGCALSLRALFHASLARLCHRRQVLVEYQRNREWPGTVYLWRGLVRDPHGPISADPTLQRDLKPFLGLFFETFDYTTAAARLPTFYFRAFSALCGGNLPPAETRFDRL